MEKNGILIPPCHLQEFADNLTELMTDNAKRNTFASYALEDCQRFALNNIVNQWLRILQTD